MCLIARNLDDASYDGRKTVDLEYLIIMIPYRHQEILNYRKGEIIMK